MYNILHNIDDLITLVKIHEFPRLLFTVIIKETVTQHSFYPFIYLRILDNQFYIFIYAFKPMHSM